VQADLILPHCFPTDSGDLPSHRRLSSGQPVPSSVQASTGQWLLARRRACSIQLNSAFRMPAPISARSLTRWQPSQRARFSMSLHASPFPFPRLREVDGGEPGSEVASGREAMNARGWSAVEIEQPRNSVAGNLSCFKLRGSGKGFCRECFWDEKSSKRKLFGLETLPDCAFCPKVFSQTLRSCPEEKTFRPATKI
jgi:hypothetical protein